MSATAAKSGLIKIGANTVAEIISWTLDIAGTVVDSTQLTDDWVTHITEGRSWSGSLECHWDATDTNGQELMDLTLASIPADVTLLFFPAGDASLSVYYSGLASITGNSMSGARGSAVSRKISFTGNGALSQLAV